MFVHPRCLPPRNMNSKYPPSKPRLRASCDGCFLAKVKCSKARPICTRCLQVGLICRYSPSNRTTPGAGGPSTINGRSLASRQLMASTLSDESCEDLGRWLSQQWAAGEHQDGHPNAPGATNMPVWHGTQAGLAAASRIGQAQGGVTILNSSHNTNPVVLAPPGWAPYQTPSYPVGPSSSYSNVPNSAKGFPAQPLPRVATFDASSVNTPSQNSPRPRPPYQQQHGAERFHPQSLSDSPTSVSASSDLSERTLACWQTQQEFRVPFGCEPSDSSEQHQTWDANSFMNNHH